MDNQKRYQNYFSTYDLGLSSALATAGYSIEQLDKTNPQKVKFIFVKSEGMDKAIQSYWNDSLKLSLLSFFNNVKALKNRIYSE